MPLLDHLVRWSDVQASYDKKIKAEIAYEDATRRWADFHPVCIQLGAERAQAILDWNRLFNLYYGQQMAERAGV